MVANMSRLQRIVDELPEAQRVEIEEWGGHPSFRVRGKNFVFSDADATSLSFKLPVDEAAAVVATESGIEPAGYGLGRHGWSPPRCRPTAARNGGLNCVSGYARRTR
ncbi:MmcQ/YjbR family DNA-binding protein [Rhodococcus sp. AG1013]|uniref:MmcQ/YjbR family DNA-binding protein n=1 Tax=Rhodococcus sp. AG1013 TaxID=2183996 RepID=UPI00215DBD30